MATPAVVIQHMGRFGVKGVSRVKLKVLEGADKDKILTRNVVGPIRMGDIVMIKDTAMDASSRFQRKG